MTQKPLLFAAMMPLLGTTAIALNLASSRALSPESRCQQGNTPEYMITNNDIMTGKDKKKNAEIRSFLWEHWSKRKRGDLSVTRFSKEGVPTISTYFVEADERGTWTIRVSLDRPTLKGTTAEHVEYRAYSVRRILSGQDGHSPADVIPDGQTLSGDSYRLIFYEQKGKEIGSV